ncbi:hypothetical protein Esti_000094 [Eimeria stiedai]
MICASHLSRVVRAAGGLPIQQRLGSKNANFATSAGGRLLNPNPRPTQYQTVVVNEAVNPAPGKPVNLTPIFICLGAFMFLFPCIQTTIELNNYYKETEELYREGWNRHHYDKMKNEYLS